MAGYTVKLIDNSKYFTDALAEANDAFLNAVGELAVGYAQDIVPVDTGALHDSIDYEIDGHRVEIGSGLDYASFVECGTRYQRAQPYLRPALADHGAEYKDIATSILRGEGVYATKYLFRRIYK